jgi:DNA-binding CsgD family transcriptional regulator
VAVAGARLLADRDDARDALRELLKIARERGLDDLSARIILYLGWLPILHRRYDGVAAYLDEGLAYADRRGLGYWHSMVAGARVRLALDQGRWHAVEAQAEQVLADPDVPSLSKLTVLVARARLRARRGDSSAWPCLDEAMDMALAHHNVEAVTCAWPARVEALWLAGRSSEAAGEARRALASGIGLQNKWWVGELTWVSQCCGERLAVVHPVAEPYALALAGDWRAAAAWWDGHGCPYETGVSLASGDDADDARRGLELLDRLGASAAAGWARGRLRSLGVAAVPRGPRAATRSNPAGLSARERQVLSLAAAGCSNGEISARLFLSLKTVERHLTNGFAKLGATSRLDAVAEARRRGAL